MNNQLYILGQQIEQKEQETIELNAKIRTVARSVDLARQELNISRPLAKEGIVPQVELIKLERQVNEMQGELRATGCLFPNSIPCCGDHLQAQRHCLEIPGRFTDRAQ